MKRIQEDYFCDGCGQRVNGEREMIACEKSHKDKVLCKFVIGNGKYRGFTNVYGIDTKLVMFSMDLWINYCPNYKIPVYTDNGIVIMDFEDCGERDSTFYKQKQIPIFRLKYLENEKQIRPF